MICLHFIPMCFKKQQQIFKFFFGAKTSIEANLALTTTPNTLFFDLKFFDYVTGAVKKWINLRITFGLNSQSPNNYVILKLSDTFLISFQLILLINNKITISINCTEAPDAYSSLYFFNHTQLYLS
jgi:hypothetical protein